MANDHTAIEWTDASWNPVSGCSRVSDGCRFCYAEALSLRFGHSKLPWTAANAAENVVLHPERLDIPKHWRKPRRIFVNSMSDLFHERVPGEFINQVWMTMFNERRHTYQILTKRPERMLEWTRRKAAATCWPIQDIWPSWIWLGVSVENQRAADERIPLLLATPAAVRFLSCEPLLGPVDLAQFIGTYNGNWTEEHLETHGWCYDASSGGFIGTPRRGDIPYDPRCGLDWVICGGESGAHARPMQAEWALSLRDQCRDAEVAYFFKQWGGRTPKANGRLLDGREWNEYPDVQGGGYDAQD